MKIGMILLDKCGRYLVDNKLPARPDFDKVLLKSFLKNKKVSSRAFLQLPESISKNVIVDNNYEVPVTIPELGAADMLLVTDAAFTYKDKSGPKFNMDNFEKLPIEVWVRKDKLK